MNQPELGKKVAELRKNKGITQEKLAELCEVTVRTIQRIEAGTADPRSFTIENLGKYLEYDFSEKKSGSAGWAAAVHLSSCLCLIPIPVMIWFFGRRKADFEEDARKAINFQITMTIILVILSLLLFVWGGSAGLLAESGRVEGRVIITVSALILGMLITAGVICFSEGIINALRVLRELDTRYIPAAKFLR